MLSLRYSWQPQLCSGQRELCTPSGQTLDTYSTLGEKMEGQNSTLFHQGLNIISPGTHFFLRFEGSELTIFSLPRDQHGYQLPINHQHINYMKLSVHCAFEEGFVGLRFVFDALTTDNSTGIRQKLKQSVPRYSTNLWRIFEWVRQKIDGEKIFGSSGFAPSIRRRIRVDPWPGGGGYRVHVDRCNTTGTPGSSEVSVLHKDTEKPNITRPRFEPGTGTMPSSVQIPEICGASGTRLSSVMSTWLIFGSNCSVATPLYLWREWWRLKQWAQIQFGVTSDNNIRPNKIPLVRVSLINKILCRHNILYFFSILFPESEIPGQ
jgi:hypothetical protein